MNSIRTNPQALAALRNFERSGTALATTQNRVSTGLKVPGAVEDASNFAISQGIRGDIRALGAVAQGMNQAKGAVGVALAGGTAISDLLNDLKRKVVEASNPGLTSTQYGILQDDIQQMLDQIDQIQQNAEFNNLNLLQGNDLGEAETLTVAWRFIDNGPAGLSAGDTRDFAIYYTSAGGSAGGTLSYDDGYHGAASAAVAAGGSAGLLTPSFTEVGLYPIASETPIGLSFDFTLDGQRTSGSVRSYVAAPDDILLNDEYPVAGAFVARGSNFHEVLTSTDGSSLQVHGQPMSTAKLFPSTVSGGPSYIRDPAANSGLALLEIDQAITTVNTRLGYLGAVSRGLDNHQAINQAVSDASEEGLGNIVDADMARESARLTAQQVRRDLSSRTLSIANEQPRILLQLFG